MSIIDDLKHYAKGSRMRLISTLFLNPNFHCVLLYRIAHFFGKCKLLIILSKIIMYINRIVYSVDIDYRADLAGGFVLVHGIGTVIGKDVKTEGPVKIYQGVTLGGNNYKEREVNGRKFSQPWLKSDVIVYANATIIGSVIIGKGSVVGAKCILTKDVPDGCVAYNRNDLFIKNL